jgi:hypothetical protein
MENTALFPCRKKRKKKKLKIDLFIENKIRMEKTRKPKP